MRRLALLLPAAFSALAAHLVVFGLHGYFAWYEPAVCLAALAALAACVRRRSLPAAPDPRTLALATVAVLWLQESVEHGSPAAPTPSQLLLALAVVALVALVVSHALRLVRGALAPVTGAVFVDHLWTVVDVALFARRPLALARAVRGPPVAA